MKTHQRLAGILLFVCIVSIHARGAVVDTITTFSPSMKKNIKAVVIRPSEYNKTQKYPVVYLLHGYSGNYAGWLRITQGLKDEVDLHKFLIVCPDGGYSSWYFDSPIDSAWKYETYISNELVTCIDKNYPTIANRKGRAITGLSMGGHGALYLAFRHQETFGAAGSTSGGVDLRPFPENWDIAKRIGDYAKYPTRWEAYSVINMTHLLKPNSLALIIDCGTGDFFYEVNIALHDKLLHNNIPHDFITRPGEHNSAYWQNSIKYQLLFFAGFFEKK